MDNTLMLFEIGIGDVVLFHKELCNENSTIDEVKNNLSNKISEYYKGEHSVHYIFTFTKEYSDYEKDIAEAMSNRDSWKNKIIDRENATVHKVSFKETKETVLYVRSYKNKDEIEKEIVELVSEGAIELEDILNVYKHYGVISITEDNLEGKNLVYETVVEI